MANKTTGKTKNKKRGAHLSKATSGPGFGILASDWSMIQS